MNVQVTKDNVTILSKDNIHEGEYRINELSFDFSEEYTSDLVINAVFTNELGKAYQVSVIDGKCHIPTEILADTGQVVLGVYAYQINGEELELRYSPFPTSFVVLSGSYDPTAEESQEITPTQYEQYMQALQNGLNQVQASISELNKATDSANDLVDEINKKLENGDFIGPQGPIGPQGEPGKDGTNGIDGVGITTITSGQTTEENGNTITPITVEKTDGSSETFNVSAKNGIDGKNGQNGKDGINGTNGIDGQDGITPNIQIGTVETLEPTEQASVTRTGTDEEPLFNFGIPKGDKGEPGEVTEETLDNVIPKQTATDSIININDALKYKAFDFKVYGAYEQNGEPTPEAPIPITTLSFDKIARRGKNLSDYQETNYQIDLQGNELVALPKIIKDELVIDKNGNVSLIKNVGKKIFNGTEDGWWLHESNQFRIQLPSVSSWGELLSNRFIEGANYEPGEMLAYVDNYILFVSDKLNVENWKTWLQSNNVVVYYELIEPQTINLGKLENLISTNEGANTFAINGNIDTQISTTYALDLKKYIDNKIATVSTAVIGE